MARLGAAVLVLLAAAAVVAFLPEPASAGAADEVAAGPDASVLSAEGSGKPCNGAIGECGADEDDKIKGATGKALSQSLLRPDVIPCEKRNRSYYTTCAEMQPPNPYQRNCDVITRCGRKKN